MEDPNRNSFMESANNSFSQTGENLSQAQSSLTNSVNNSVNDTMNSFSQQQQMPEATKSFLDSNGLIAKIVFLIMVIIVFLVLFFLGMQLMGYYLKPSSTPMLVDGQISGNNQMVITQNPANKSSVTITRSNNEATGIEFTWSVWLSIGTTGSAGSTVTPNWHSPVFVKGDVSLPNNGTNDYCSLNNGPGVYFGPPSDPNHLYILMDTVQTAAITSSNLVIDVGNLPTDYFHLAIRCQNTYIDVYINGTLVKRHNLMNVPKQNYYDVVVCPYNGFNGFLSNLQYFNYSLSVIDLNNIVKKGPNTTSLTKKTYNKNATNAISTYWYNSFLQ
jgi:hypothetical protein